MNNCYLSCYFKENRKEQKRLKGEQVKKERLNLNKDKT